MLIPRILLLCLILFAKISTPKTKRYGDNGQPCLTPLDNGKESVVKPLFKTELSVFA